MSASGPRLLRFEWSACARDFFGTIQTVNGPGEVLLIGNSFAPTYIASLRLGDRNRDVTLDAPVVGNPNYGGSSTRFNIRFVGVLPMTRVYELGGFGGSYAYEVTGFLEGTSLAASYPDPGPPFYAQVRTFTAAGLAVAGEYRYDPATGSELHDNRIARGTLSERIDSPATPLHGAHTYSESVSYQGVHAVFRMDYPPQGIGRLSLSIDGKAQTNIPTYWGFKGCTAP